MVHLQPEGARLSRLAASFAGAALLVLVPGATAQPEPAASPAATAGVYQFAPAPPSRRPPPVEITRVEFGWGGQIVPERWNPVRVWLTSRGEPFAGVLSIQFPQDATQDSVVSIPVATTPGEEVPFELALCPAVHIDEMTLELADERGRSQRITFGGIAGLPAPPLIQGLPPVLVVGESSASLAFGAGVPDPTRFEVGSQVSQVETLWSLARRVDGTPASLPTCWMAYESLGVVVTDSRVLATADARARAALLEWVAWGGRLVVTIDPAGEGWREAAPGLGGLVEALPAAARTPGEAARRSTLDPERPKARPKPAPPPFALPTRVLHVTPAGVRAGWSALWPVDELDAGHGLMARGPVGLGMVTLVAVDPSRLAGTLSDVSTANAWREVLAGEHGALPSHVRSLTREQITNAVYNTMSAWATDAAIPRVLNDMAENPEIGWTTFVLLGLVLAGLVALLGPFDWRRARRGSSASLGWLRALGWIAVASLVAWALPAMARKGDSLLSRTTITDVVQRPGRTPLVWRTQALGFFAGRPITLALDEPAGTWCRGVSPVRWWGERLGRFGPLDLALTPPGVQGEPRATRVGPLRLSQWTFRTLLTQEPATSPTPASAPPTARLEADPSGVRVIVTGLSPGAEWSSGVVSLRRPGESGVTHAPVRLGSVAGRDGEPSHEGLATAFDPQMPREFKVLAADEHQPQTEEQASPADFVSLPGPLDRADAVTAMVESGAWASLVLSLPAFDAPTGVSGGRVDDRHRRRALYRFLIPIPPEPEP